MERESFHLLHILFPLPFFVSWEFFLFLSLMKGRGDRNVFVSVCFFFTSFHNPDNHFKVPVQPKEGKRNTKEKKRMKGLNSWKKKKK